MSEGFLSRWSKRRELVEQEEQELEQAKAAEEAAAEAQSEQAETPEEAEGAVELPDPDSIEEGGSFAAFMGADVDQETRNQALRKLWQQPQYQEIDNMAEYALDYSNQPLLSAEESLELVEKVYRHVVKDEEPEEEMLADAEGEASDEPTASLEDNSDAIASNQDSSTPLNDDVGQIEPDSKHSQES
ncbi:DUF3306 domain-containing protein [Paraferrimonas sedimenticola]|uniref:DUF3306 domain-containing protein n=1 Tax=Paraferrimonas sedimenticola TaxID=375674 RepID=A0AA37RYG6_9GAMM|nr:DUF3306 domain-containing protein [Paraferrimonas sedimenticola]GLP97549.1 hypothetical protein GCM10007895_28560 [Paraferrimonas sedimenticola]